MNGTSTRREPSERCARAFRNQQDLAPYQELLRDTSEWLDPTVGQRWLDLGCGAGQLARVLWEKSEGRVEAIVGVDADVANARAFASLRAALQPTPTPACLRFVARSFSEGFADWPGAQFDGVVSGLALQYADDAGERDFDVILAEVHRLLKPGGVFVFSVNVPSPAWNRVAMAALSNTFQQERPLRHLKHTWRMWTYGAWLTQETHTGRFHSLPLEAITCKLASLGFAMIEERLSYAQQAYLIRCRK